MFGKKKMTEQNVRPFYNNLIHHGIVTNLHKMFEIEMIDDPHDVEKYRVVDQNGREIFVGDWNECHAYIYGNLTV